MAGFKRGWGQLHDLRGRGIRHTLNNTTPVLNSRMTVIMTSFNEIFLVESKLPATNTSISGFVKSNPKHHKKNNHSNPNFYGSNFIELLKIEMVSSIFVLQYK